MNKASGGDGIPAELFQILKDAVKVRPSICQKIRKTSAVATVLQKMSVFIPIPRRAMPKNVQTTIELCSFHMLARLCSKSFKLGFSQLESRTSTCTSQISKRQRTRDQIADICWIVEKAKEFQKNIYFCFIDCAKAFDCVNHKKLWKILKEMGLPDHLTCLLRNLYAR